ncbi:2-nitropropane dioxygenase, variant 2 [Coprinopsis cinerea AmutBmut pab1-1]|nr:2-nitropropane dioxygenase, variant 2 [Coprinopsis cinerea AmutBmut pab1-1]
MAGASGGALAAQVTLAGGFGFLAAGYGSADKLRAEFEIARNLIQPNEKGILPVGVGFLGWLLDKNEELAKEQISVALEYGVQAIWLSFGDRLDYWVDYIRKLNESKCGHKVLFFVQITSAKEAEMAVNVLKADIIVAQGTEAGGHGSANGLSLLALVPSVLSVVPPDGPPVLAAGGLVTGAHLAALLALGASGIVIGTRFLLCPESLYTDSQRNALLSADSTQSVRTMAFDEARETLGWPKGIDGRGLHNATVEDYNRGEDVKILRKKYQEAQEKDDTSRIVVWAGASVGLMNKIQPAKEVVTEIHEECRKRLNVVASLGL